MGGLCGVSQKQAESEVVQRRTARPHSYNNTDVNRKDDKKSEKFNDMEEYTDGKIIGEGIKQIPSYKCTLPYDKLQELRNEFWSTKKNSRVWLVLKTCCETDALSAKELLSAEELQIIGSSIRCVISTSNPEHIFNVPNFCVTDPVHEKDFACFENSEDKVKEKKFTVVVIYVFDNTENKIIVSNKTLGKELKVMYSELANRPLNKYILRLLHKGQEIKDEHALFYHNIDENAKIQVSIAEI